MGDSVYVADLKRCGACGAIKPLAAFAFANQALRKRQGNCRVCHAAYRRAHYLAHKADYVRRAAAQVTARRDGNRRRLFDYLLAHPCVGCGAADPTFLEFDHQDPADKLDAVTALAKRRRWAVVATEIGKCDVRCVNCHRRRTAEQYAWAKRARRPTMQAMRE